jgi:glycine oxidase
MHVGIVGAGIMGLVLAQRLSRLGWGVSLFEQNAAILAANNCSYAAAGLLTPTCEMDKANPLIFALGQQGLQDYWPVILSQLTQPVFFQQNGCIVVHYPQDHNEWSHFELIISSKLSHHNSILLDKNSLANLEPGLQKFAKGYFFPHEGQIDAQEILMGLATDLQASGMTFYSNTTVIQVESFQVKTSHGAYSFDWVFDCRGLGAKQIFKYLRAIRGELLWLHAPEVHLQRPIRLLHPRYSFYIVPRPGNIFLVGATELEAEDYGEISLRTTLELLSSVYCLNSGFAEARILKTVTQCRPALPSNLPAIKSREGLTAINGLYRHGFLIAPSLAEEVLRGILGKKNQLHYPQLWEDHDYHLS